MDTTPLPTGEGDFSDSDSVSLSSDSPTYYVLRVHSYGKFTFDELHKEFQENSNFCQYVIGKENDTGNEHYHVVVGVDESFTEEDLRSHIKGFLHPFWVTDAGKMPKGFGNKQYNCQPCKDLDAAVSYAVKLGEYRYDGFDEEYILSRKEASFLKKKPSTFKQEFFELEKKFLETDMDVMQFMKEYGYLKSKFGQLTIQNAVAVTTALATRKDHSYWDNIVEDFLYKH